MFIEKEYMQLNGTGLNGWFNDFWQGFKSGIGLSNNNGNGKGFSRWLGRNLARLVLTLATARTRAEYQPTPSELIVLNPIKNDLNNWATELIYNVDFSIENAITNQDKINALNNVAREINIALDYYNLRTDNRLSSQAYDYLINSLQELVDVVELSIEDILDENLINYTKSEVPLVKQTDDFYPIPQIYTTNFESSGNQYFLPTNQNPINVDIPINNTITPITDGGIRTNIINPPKDVGTVVNNSNAPMPNNASSNNSKTGNYKIALGLFTFTVLIALLLGDDNKKKSKTIKN